MLRKIFFTLLMVTFISCFAYSQTVDDIVNNMNKSRGGSEAYTKILNWKMTGTTSMMGQSIAFIQFFKKPNMFRSEQDMMGQKIIQTFDGQKGWMINPMTGSNDAQPMDSATIEQMKRMNDIFEGPVNNYKEKGIKIDLLGKDDVNGVSCYKMKIVNNTNESTLWVNNETYLPVKMKSTVNQMGNNMEVETNFLDYKDFQNIKMPTKVVMNAMGMEISMLFEKIELNTAIDDAIFKKP
ncbi:MAG: outer membrane lipoprotein-sorting protein [Bacteroidetes bacterium]|nr:MAG: outer membrane lipoprotein-sorting protein [Bacteroidota bacterium]